MCSLEIIYRIYIITDAVRNARRQKNYILKSYNNTFNYFANVIAIGILSFYYPTRSILGLQSFHCPGSANEPTILLDDYFIADMQVYDYAPPQLGDIVVYKKEDGQLYTHRIAALPNDTFELRNNIAVINGKMSKETFIKDTALEENIQAKEFEEELPNGMKHHIYKFNNPYDSSKAAVNSIIIPAGCYYVLGDNRDNALDSRYIGVIKKENIKGKVLYSYWGKTTDRININFRDK